MFVSSIFVSGKLKKISEPGKPPLFFSTVLLVSIKPLISGNSKLRRAWAADLLELFGQIFVSSHPILVASPSPELGDLEGPLISSKSTWELFSQFLLIASQWLVARPSQELRQLTSSESPCHCSILLLNSCSTAEGFSTNSGAGAAYRVGGNFTSRSKSNEPQIS